MKKILLASTILVGTAGFAAADNANFTFSGDAYVGVAYTTLGAGAFTVEAASSFTVGMMTTTDGGLEAGASITVDAPGVTMDDDHTATTFGGITENAMSVSETSLYLSGDWGKLAVKYDANGSGAGATTSDWDVVFTYSNTWGDFGLSAYYTVAIDGAAGTNGDLGAEASYSFGDYSVMAGINWDNSISDWDVDLGASASMSGFSGSVELNYDNATTDWDYMAELGYSTGAYSFGAFVEEDDGVDTNPDFGINAGYDLGGGVSIDGAYIYDNDLNAAVAKLGVSMAF